MKKKILIVDDESDLLDLLGLRLRANGYDVCIALNGVEGLRVAAEERPDLILLDVSMPQMNGFQVCEHLRRNPVTRHTPIVLLTAKTRDTDKLIGMEAGANDYVIKPFDMDALLKTIAHHLTTPSMPHDYITQKNPRRG